MTKASLLTPMQVAQRLRISRFTVMDYLRKGRLRGVKLERSWRVREEDLQAFIEARLRGDPGREAP